MNEYMNVCLSDGGGDGGIVSIYVTIICGTTTLPNPKPKWLKRNTHPEMKPPTPQTNRNNIQTYPNQMNGGRGGANQKNLYYIQTLTNER